MLSPMHPEAGKPVSSRVHETLWHPRTDPRGLGFIGFGGFRGWGLQPPGPQSSLKGISPMKCQFKPPPTPTASTASLWLQLPVIFRALPCKHGIITPYFVELEITGVSPKPETSCNPATRRASCGLFVRTSQCCRPGFRARGLGFRV